MYDRSNPPWVCWLPSFLTKLASAGVLGVLASSLSSLEAIVVTGDRRSPGRVSLRFRRLHSHGATASMISTQPTKTTGLHHIHVKDEDEGDGNDDGDDGNTNEDDTPTPTTDDSTDDQPTPVPHPKPKPKPKPKPGPTPVWPPDSGDLAPAYESAVYPLDGYTHMRYGAKVAANGDVLVVGTDSTGSSAGNKVYVYDIHQANATVLLGTLSSSKSADSFGQAVCVSDSYVFIGAASDDTVAFMSGAVYVYGYSHSSVSSVPVQLLQSPSPLSLGGGFGSSVAAAGGWLAVGAPMDSVAHSFSGAVYVYGLDETSGLWTYSSMMTDASPSPLDNFGAALAFAS
eukprot:gene32435-39222_t